MLKTFSFSRDTVGFLMEGEITKSVIKQLNTSIEERLALFDKINLYLEDSQIENFSLPAVMDHIKFKFSNRDRFNKIAFVTDRKWIHWCATMNDFLMDGSIESFLIEDRLDAIAWIADDLNL